MNATSLSLRFPSALVFFTLAATAACSPSRQELARGAADSPLAAGTDGPSVLHPAADPALALRIELAEPGAITGATLMATRKDRSVSLPCSYTWAYADATYTEWGFECGDGAATATFYASSKASYRIYASGTFTGDNGDVFGPAFVQAAEASQSDRTQDDAFVAMDLTLGTETTRDALARMATLESAFLPLVGAAISPDGSVTLRGVQSDALAQCNPQGPAKCPPDGEAGLNFYTTDAAGSTTWIGTHLSLNTSETDPHVAPADVLSARVLDIAKRAYQDGNGVPVDIH